MSDFAYFKTLSLLVPNAYPPPKLIQIDDSSTFHGE